MAEDRQRFLVLSYHDEIAWRLWHKADQQGEETCGHHLATEHITPSCGDRPLSVGHVGNSAGSVIDRIGVRAEDEEVDKVYHELTEDDGELVPADEHATDARGCYLTDIHRADSRCHAHADAAKDAVEVKDDEQRPCRLAVGQESERLRCHRAPCREEEADAGEDQRALAAKARGEESGESGTDDTADECAGRCEAVKKVVVLKIFGPFEEGLETFLGSTDHGGVIAKEQSAEHRHHDDADEVGAATSLLRLFFHYLGLLSYLFFVLWCKDTLFDADMLYHMLLNYVSNVSNIRSLTPHTPLQNSLTPIPLSKGRGE